MTSMTEVFSAVIFCLHTVHNPGFSTFSTKLKRLNPNIKPGPTRLGNQVSFLHGRQSDFIDYFRRYTALVCALLSF